MNSNISGKSLSEVLDELAVSEERIDAESIARWIRRYPEFETELMDFAARWSVMTHLPPDESALEDEEKFYAGGLDAIKNVIRANREKSASSLPPIASLLAEGERQGLNIGKLASLSDLSVTLIAKFENRLISFPTIPGEAIMNVARSLKRSYDSVATYLQRAPSFAHGASYKSDTAPELQPQQDFSSAVETDRTMTEDKRARWINLASRSGNKP